MTRSPSGVTSIPSNRASASHTAASPRSRTSSISVDDRRPQRGIEDLVEPTRADATRRPSPTRTRITAHASGIDASPPSASAPYRAATGCRVSARSSPQSPGSVRMPVTVVVGAQWGDEGKAKIIDLLPKEHTYVVRYQGGHNAGHTVVVERREVRAAADPERGALRPRHPGDRQRRRRRPADAVPRDRRARGARRVVRRPQGVESGPPDLSVAPGPRRDRRGDARRRQDRHDAEGDRPGVRRQGAAGRRARR